MIRLFIDEHERTLEAILSGSIQEIVAHVEEHYLKPNRVIREILVDGLPLVIEGQSGGEFTTSADGAVKERIEISTASIEEIAEESIREAVAYLERVEAAIPSIAEGFRGYPAPSDHENLRQLCEGLYWLNLLSDRLRTTFRLPKPGIDSPAAIAGIVQRDQVRLLRDLVDAQEQRDYTRLSRLLEGEILTLMPTWREFFSSYENQAASTCMV